MYKSMHPIFSKIDLFFENLMVSRGFSVSPRRKIWEPLFPTNFSFWSDTPWKNLAITCRLRWGSKHPLTPNFVCRHFLTSIQAYFTFKLFQDHLRLKKSIFPHVSIIWSLTQVDGWISSFFKKRSYLEKKWTHTIF